VLPRGAARTLRDPYEDRGARTRHWLLALAAVAVIAALATARWYRVWPFARSAAPATAPAALVAPPAPAPPG
jgi:hypothetical protein